MFFNFAKSCPGHYNLDVLTFDISKILIYLESETDIDWKLARQSFTASEPDLKFVSIMSCIKENSYDKLDRLFISTNWVLRLFQCKEKLISSNTYL